GIRRGLKAGRGARDPGFPSPENRSPADPPDAAGRRDGGDSLADRSLPDQRGHPADPIQLRLGFPFNLALCTVLQTIPMALPTARGRQGPQELSAYRRTTRGKGSLVIFFAQANPPPRSAAEAVRRLRHGVDPAHAGGRAFNGFGPSAELDRKSVV